MGRHSVGSGAGGGAVQAARAKCRGSGVGGLGRKEEASGAKRGFIGGRGRAPRHGGGVGGGVLLDHGGGGVLRRLESERSSGTSGMGRWAAAWLGRWAGPVGEEFFLYKDFLFFQTNKTNKNKTK